MLLLDGVDHGSPRGAVRQITTLTGNGVQTPFLSCHRFGPTMAKQVDAVDLDSTGARPPKPRTPRAGSTPAGRNAGIDSRSYYTGASRRLVGDFYGR